MALDSVVTVNESIFIVTKVFGSQVFRNFLLFQDASFILFMRGSSQVNK